ncbi:hypothetical protein E9W_07156, partial [Moraxella catarrhalis CO72]
TVTIKTKPERVWFFVGYCLNFLDKILAKNKKFAIIAILNTLGDWLNW